MTNDLTAANAAAARAPFDPSLVSRWQPASFNADICTLPLIVAADAAPILPDLDLWDCWPLELPDGKTANVDGPRWWFFLSAPRFDDPGQRHDAARIRLVAQRDGQWIDHGNALAGVDSPGSREWAGSAVLWPDQTVSLFFTAAGRAGEAPSFEQRLFETKGRLVDGVPGDWQQPQEIVVADGDRYVIASEAAGEPGAIKGFRDPAYFHDPATGLEHILFTGSAGWDDHSHNGVVGIATRMHEGWALGDPLIAAVGINNELERPHIRLVDGRYYLFFSTQRRTFAPDAVAGPNGLYAMVADQMNGPWRPVNGHGLVAGNPAAEPTQVYSWWVLGEGEAIGFIDHWGMAGRDFDTHPELLRSQFGGTPSPMVRLRYDGDTVAIA
jgi:levansucrase